MTESDITRADDLSPDALGRALADIAGFLTPSGWDLPPQLFALVPTAVLAREQPDIVEPGDPSELSPVAEDPLPDTSSIESALATASWPPMVVGCALVQEITVLPPEEPEAAPADGRRARLLAGALRDGRTLALLQVRPDTDDTPAELRTHPDLAPDLRNALLLTLDERD